MIFLAGTKGQRIITPNTTILSHRWAGESGGKAHELFAAQKEFNLTSHRMLQHYIQTTGKSETHVKKFLLPPEDVFLSADEALKHGICDKIAFL
jgi:ATP-dependent Clp protease protease subunit